MSLDQFKQSKVYWVCREIRRRSYSKVASHFRALSNEKRILPNFLIIGAQKAGTTFLHFALTGHPEIKPPWRKEVHYFDINFNKGLDWYKSHFPHGEMGPKGKPMITGEASPEYMLQPYAPARIAKLLPDAKVIIVLREPASRALSQYKMALWRGKEPLSFREAIEKEDERTVEDYKRAMEDPTYVGLPFMRFGYRTRGLYLEQIKRVEQHFPKENILVIDSNTLFKQTDEALFKVERFLGIDEWKPSVYKPEAASRVRDFQEDKETMAALREFYRPHNEALFDHLGWDPIW